MSRVKAAIKDWLPPAILRVIKNSQAEDILFEGNYSSWEKASSKCSGYDVQSILNKVLESTLKVKRGEAAFERDSVLFDKVEYDWPITAGLLWSAALDGGNLDVLDFGGALGSSYFQNRSFLAALPKVRWSVIEQEHYVKAGCDHIQDENLRFYSSIHDCLTENQPNVILLSSVLQYLSDPDLVIERICNIGAKVILVDKTIINGSDENSIHIQTVPSSIYEASYPCRSFSERYLMERFLIKYRLVSEFSSIEFTSLSQINSKFNGYIFSRVM